MHVPGTISPLASQPDMSRSAVIQTVSWVESPDAKVQALPVDGLINVPEPGGDKATARQCRRGLVVVFQPEIAWNLAPVKSSKRAER